MSDDFSREEVMEMHPKGKPLTPEGAEVPDPVPLEPPLGYVRRPSLAEQIRQMVVSEQLRLEAEAGGAESFEDADDFDVGDDYDPTSPYEHDFDAVPVSELKKRKTMAEEKPEKRSSKKGSPATSQEGFGEGGNEPLPEDQGESGGE